MRFQNFFVLTVEHSFDAKSFLKNAPPSPGVYQMFDENHVLLYVGKAKNLKKRLASYFQKKLNSPRIALMVSQIARIQLNRTATEKEALLLENTLIKTQNPRYNILFRDDKSYPYIALSKEDFPRMSFFRGTPRHNADYFGPFPCSSAVQRSMALLEKIFKLRTCENSVFRFRTRACLLFQIKRCSGACTGEISQKAYQEDVAMARLFLSGKNKEVLLKLKEAMLAASQNLAFESALRYKNQIETLNALMEKQNIHTKTRFPVDIINIFIENGSAVLSLAMVRGGQYLGSRAFFPKTQKNISPEDAVEILESFLSLYYTRQEAPHSLIVGEELLDEETKSFLFNEFHTRCKTAQNPKEKSWLKLNEENAKQEWVSANHTQQNAKKRHRALEERLNQTFNRVECFDISHTFGENAVASVVVYENFQMNHAQYRQINIENITPGDDYAAMHQALLKRYKSALKNEGVLPDVIFIDGGMGQLQKAHESLTELGLGHLFLMGIAKGVERKAGLEELCFLDGKRLRLEKTDPALHLIQEIRDESHRFALTRHQQKRAKARKASVLENIEGVGGARRKILLTQFGSLENLKKAKLQEIQKTPKIPPRVAENIFAALHQNET